MSFFHALILGIVEGLTEFLPISSTAHLMIANRLLGIPITDFVKSFNIFIQLGAILAVIILYLRHILTDRTTLIKICLAFIPTAIIGIIVYPLAKKNFLGNIPLAAWALIIGGIIMIIFEYYHNRKADEPISFKRSIIIGIFQAIALIPGVSRAGATIIGGQALGINRKKIVEFSFLLAIPTMVAASGLDLIKTNINFDSSEWLLLLTGFICAFITALIAIKFFLRYISRHSFTTFGWYRIAIGILILLFT